MSSDDVVTFIRRESSGSQARTEGRRFCRFVPESGFGGTIAVFLRFVPKKLRIGDIFEVTYLRADMELHIHSNQQASNIIDKHRLTLLQPEQYDVGVDNNKFTPVSYRQIEQIIERRKNEKDIT